MRIQHPPDAPISNISMTVESPQTQISIPNYVQSIQYDGLEPFQTSTGSVYNFSYYDLSMEGFTSGFNLDLFREERSNACWTVNGNSTFPFHLKMQVTFQGSNGDVYDKIIYFIYL